MLKENNVRDRVLSPDEYASLLEHCADHLRPIVTVAYHTGMRRGEILQLVWARVDLKEGFIRLQPEDTKTEEGRDIPLDHILAEMFAAMPRGLPGVRVFTRNGEPINCIRESFEAACTKAGIEDFTFHDLRHTFVTNWRKAGIHESVIMKVTGQKNLEHV
jgi:integrase